MIDLEIPTVNKTKKYIFLEKLPAILSYSLIGFAFLLSAINPVWGSVYILVIVIVLIVRAVAALTHTIVGRRRIHDAQKVNWDKRLLDLERQISSSEVIHSRVRDGQFGYRIHEKNLRAISDDPTQYPLPSDIYNAVIIATYNETIDVLEPTIQSVIDTTYQKDHLILVLAYEERGGPDTKELAQKLQKKYKKAFKEFYIVEHPDGLPNEVRGKGGNITYAGQWLQSKLDAQGIEYKNVIITTLDSDNRPHPTYFDYLTYEYIVHKDRKHLAYQPVALFFNNIWDVPAPARVVATSNSFWSLISSMRPHVLFNFASHSQPMDALVEMNFWSTKTIVEDGHQYWRSYFHFAGNYSVTPIYVPIYQDAVLSETYIKTLRAQFIQLRRWAYGASDIAYIANIVFSKSRNVSLFSGIARFSRLIDAHVSLAAMPLLIFFGGWIPTLVGGLGDQSLFAVQLPSVVATIQRIGMIGIIVMIIAAFQMFPPMPKRYTFSKRVGMLLQWLLIPLVAIFYNSAAAINSQTRLLFGRYLDKFDVTEKATIEGIERAKGRA